MENKIFLFSTKYPLLEKLFTMNGAIITHNPFDEFEIAVFTPGPDVSPFLYGEKRIKKSLTDFPRDMRENNLYRALPMRCPKIGIGRGAQFLNVMNGGTLHQHVTGHTSPHAVIDVMTGNEMQVTSYHHQEMIVPELGDILCCANAADKKEGPLGVQGIDIASNAKSKMYADTEVAYFEPTKSLLFQPRPEMDVETTPGKNTKNLFFQYYEEWILPESKGMFRIKS